MLKGHVFKNQIFENQIFALFINLFMNQKNGVARSYKNAMRVTYSGHTVTVDSGAVCVQGRFLEEDSSTTIDTGIETMFCKLVVEVDLSKTNTATGFTQGIYNIVKSASSYPNLTQEDIAGTATGKYQYELARFKISDGVVSDFQDMRTYLEDQLQYGGIAQLNSSKAPANHASTNTNYGVGTTTNYGHVKFQNDLNASSLVDGVALPAYQGFLLNQNKLGKTIFVNTPNTDLNDYKNDGIYYFETNVTPINIPIGLNGWLIVFNRGQNKAFVKQIWLRMGTAGTNDMDTYVRTYNTNNGWSEWSKFVVETDEKKYMSNKEFYCIEGEFDIDSSSSKKYRDITMPTGFTKFNSTIISSKINDSFYEANMDVYFLNNSTIRIQYNGTVGQGGDSFDYKIILMKIDYFDL